jgi:hypothetical protein
VSYTSVFGGTTIFPSDVSYLSIALTVDTPLEWPLESSGNLDPAARIIDVTPDASGRSIVMPDATLTGAGQTILFNNIDATFSFFVKDFAGNTLATVTPGTQWQVYLAATTTAAGTWRVFQYGASTATVQPSALAGYGLTVTGSTLSQSLPVTTLSTTGVTVSVANRASAFVWTGTGAGTLNLLTAAAAGNNFFIFVRNEGGGDMTVEPAGTETINSDANLMLRPGDSATLITDGTTWYTIGLGRQAVFAFDYTSISVTGGNYTLAGAELNRIAYKFVGLLTSDVYIIVPPTVQQYWINNATTGAFSLFVRTSGNTPKLVGQGAKGIYYCDGTNIILGSDPTTLTTPIVISDGGTGATTASAARLNLGITLFADPIVTATSGASVRTTIGAAASGANTDITSLAAGLGTAGAPSYSFTGDLNTGMWSPGADTVAVSTGGTERMRLDSVGNLGLNVTPVAGYGNSIQLKQAGASAVSSLLQQSVGTDNQNLELLNNALPPAGGYTAGYNYTYTGASATMYRSESGAHKWFNAPTGTAGAAVTFAERMRIDSTGNVGIGTSAPTAKLNVAGDTIISGNADARQIGFNFYGTSQYNFYVDGATDAARMTIRSGTTSVATFDSSGNVGIGNTPSGTYKLEVTGAAYTSSMVLGAALPVASGGTGQTTYTNGQLLIGNTTGNTLAKATLTAGSGISITNGAGSITIAATGGGGTVTSVGGTGTVNGITLTGTVTSSGNLTLGGTLSGVSLTSQVSGTLPIANGGTGATTAANARTALSAAASGANTDITALDQDVTVTATGTISASTIGYRGIPQNAQAGAYTLVLADAGKHISNTTGGFAIPANGTTAFPIGTTIVLYNNSSSSQNVTITTDTLRLAGTATTGTLVLAQYGLATCVKVNTTVWVASGAGLS